MDTGRVAACAKLENKRRKFLIVINDVVKTKYDVYAEHLDRVHDETDNRFEKSKLFVRRALVRQKVLQQCMKMRRKNVDPKNVFGTYGGKPIDAFGRDIEHFVAYNHPRMRRKRQIQKLMNESLEKGAILKKNVVSDRVASWMERSYTKYKLKHVKKEKTVLEPIPERRNKLLNRRSDIPRLPVLSNPFYTGGLKTEEPAEEKEADVLQLTENIAKIELGKEAVKTRDKAVDDSRPTLRLPPITTSKAMVSIRDGLLLQE